MHRGLLKASSAVMESVAVMIEGGEARIVPSAVYDVNLQQFQQQASSADALCFYLKPSKNVQSEDAGIVSKADEITAGIADAYGKVRAIHDWVASYLYFDYDALAQPGRTGRKMRWGLLSAAERYVKVTQTRRRLCCALQESRRRRSSDTLLRIGTYMGFFEYAGLQGESRLDGGFADGRWILMDPTWDSGNYYLDGKYQTSDAVHTYFDSTVEFFLLYSSSIPSGCLRQRLCKASVHRYRRPLGIRSHPFCDKQRSDGRSGQRQV